MATGGCRVRGAAELWVREARSGLVGRRLWRDRLARDRGPGRRPRVRWGFGGSSGGASFRWSTSTFETGNAPCRPGFPFRPYGGCPWCRWTGRGCRPTPMWPTVAERGRLRGAGDASASRAFTRSVIRRVVVQDAFGLSRIAFQHRQPGPIEVLPHLGGIRRLPVLTSLTGGEEYPHPMGLEDGDRVELRRYVPGDSARFIHWKVFGRTRKLMVRMPERALSRARRTVAYLVAGAARRSGRRSGTGRDRGRGPRGGLAVRGRRFSVRRPRIVPRRSTR